MIWPMDHTGVDPWNCLPLTSTSPAFLGVILNFGEKRMSESRTKEKPKPKLLKAPGIDQVKTDSCAVSWHI